MYPDEGLKPEWTTVSEASDACYELIHCGSYTGAEDYVNAAGWI